MSCPNLALVHTSIEHSRDWCRRLLILGCQEPYAHQALHPVRWCGRLLKTTPGVFAPVIENAKRPDAGAVMAWGVAIVAVMILFTPLLLRCPPFRRWYGRTDALSERQRQALAERGLRRYYQTAFDDGYVPRVMPYVWRIIWTVGGLMAVTAVLPTNTGRPAFDALVVFSTWYPIGVMLLVFASRPLGRLIRQRAQERRK
ncbi:transposase [Enterobacter cloacae complex sp. CDL006]|uniref:transposase n=2 Tax=Pseudomonadota TaxID=1224 RepID=UPI00005330BA|nr:MULTISPECIES: transposase [Enterobacterales]MCB4349094.1 transposase [Burkholderia vietnamiensis]MCC2874440.1 transposase [Enterobacter asburiae]MCC2909433.1 transposase [Enterobacter hormaechei]MCC2918937.1 transposase [Enterobacter hormaechei]MCC2936189.1 transposase [Enterobacter hormaechei]